MRCPHGVDTAVEPCLRCTMVGPVEPFDLEMHHAFEDPSDAFSLGVTRERARIRAIVWKYLAKEYTGNAILKEIDDGP